MDIQKVKIISNNIGYGPEPTPADEVEQHLTISSTGMIWFTGYNYGGGFGNYEIGRRHLFSIGKVKANNIFLSLISRHFDNSPLSICATDIGEWKIIITDAGGDIHKFKGTLCGGVIIDNIDLTEYIREHIPVDNLLVFDYLDMDEDMQ